MSVLLILMPPRGRRRSATAAAGEWSWLHSPDGVAVGRAGRSGPRGFPRADSVVAVPADGDVAWHRITLPKAPPARLAQALHGVLEEQVLEDDGAVHFALAPDATAGKPSWIAVMHRGWLAAQVAALEAAGRPVDRVSPPAAPGGAPEGHFAAAESDTDGAALRLVWTDADGSAPLGLDGTLARARVAAVGDRPVRWTATPSAAAAAEAWLGHPLAVIGDGERALRALGSRWNLRQFELAPRHRGTTALREAWASFWSPPWRAARIGLAALAAVHLVGLNAWAWHEQRALQTRRTEMAALLQSSFPQVRAVLDAPRQMARETAALRAAAGQPGDDDLETLLAVAAGAWPPDEDPVPSLRFEPGRLTLGAPDWGTPEVDALRRQLQPAGWSVTHADGALTLARAAQGASR
ncbi:MAG: type II secretion system protein GspL [Rubrivivax sp.]